MKLSSKIFVSGHNGLVGSSILRKLRILNYKHIITANKKDLDLRDQKKLIFFLKKTNLSM